MREEWWLRWVASPERDSLALELPMAVAAGLAHNRQERASDQAGECVLQEEGLGGLSRGDEGVAGRRRGDRDVASRCSSADWTGRRQAASTTVKVRAAGFDWFEIRDLKNRKSILQQSRWASSEKA